MSGGLGYSQQESNQNSQSTTGISRTYKEPLSRMAFEGAGNLNAATNAAQNSPFGYFQGQTGAQMMNLDPTTGLPSTFNPFMQSMANNMFSKASAGGAMRGQLSPDSTPGIVGSAITNLGAQALPYVTQFAQQSAMLPEQIRAQRLGYLQANQASMASLLGSQSDYTGSSSGFGFNVTGSALPSTKGQ